MTIRRVLIAASEIHPFAKTGGLADAAGSLAKALHHKGVDVRVVMPKYKAVQHPSEPVGTLKVPGDDGYDHAVIHQVQWDGPPVYLVEKDELYDRDDLYHHDDNPARFSFFARAVVALPGLLGWKPDVIHVNDWHAGLVPAYLYTYKAELGMEGVGTLYTIHNLQYQGKCGADALGGAGLPDEMFCQECMLDEDQASFMKAGIVFCDVLNTVSPTYAKEILIEEYGCGLETLLAQYKKKLHGVLNGIDTAYWDPDTDKALEHHFSAEEPSARAENKLAFYEEVGLPRDDNRALVGMVTRLAGQKGLDIFIPIVSDIVERADVVVLGTGEKKYESALASLAERHPNLKVILKYDEEMAHRIYASSDIFLVPSKFEPCGLTQMIALRYGAVPLVRKTGGLADTIKDVDANADGNGFVFENYRPEDFMGAMHRALSAYKNKGRWAKVVARGMAQDLSWGASADKYVELYEEAVENASRKE